MADSVNEGSAAMLGSVLRGRAALLLQCPEHIAVGSYAKMNMHALADELNEAAAVIESLSDQLSSLRKTAATLMDIAASGADPNHRRRLLDRMGAESFAEDG